jgi:[protein-PII] uridylyltransferase
VKAGPVASTFLVQFAAKDRAELFARLAGAISLAGLDILSADAYPAPGGFALDVFTVASATLASVDPTTWTALERLTRAALADRLELETRLAERARHYPPRARGDVSVEVGSAGWDTTIRVKAPDRPGLLYDLARAVSASGLDIRWAKILTVEGMAIDTFHAVGPDGRAEDNPGVLGHLAMRLRESV